MNTTGDVTKVASGRRNSAHEWVTGKLTGNAHTRTDSIIAITPATCGVAMLVPEIVMLAVSLSNQPDKMAEPGANTSTHEP